MPAVDLTHDFEALVLSIQSSGAVAVAGGVRHRSPIHVHDHSSIASDVASAPLLRSAHQVSRFTGAVGEIAKDITATSMKLSQLTALVRSRSTFNDRSRDINRITLSLKNDLQRLNARLDELQTADAVRRSGGRKQTDLHALNVVSSLKSQLAVTTKTFKDVLKVRTESMRATSDRKARFGRERNIGKPLVYAPSHTTGPPPGSDSATGRLAVSSPSVALPRPDGVATPTGAATSSSALFSPVSAQALQPDTAHYEARAAEVQSIESHIVDLGQLFGRLSHMISEQNEMVNRLEDNVEDSLDNVERGTTELTRKLASVSSNRKLLLSVFAILMVFVVFFSVFLA